MHLGLLVAVRSGMVNNEHGGPRGGQSSMHNAAVDVGSVSMRRAATHQLWRVGLYSIRALSVRCDWVYTATQHHSGAATPCTFFLFLTLLSVCPSQPRACLYNGALNDTSSLALNLLSKFTAPTVDSPAYRNPNHECDLIIVRHCACDKEIEPFTTRCSSVRRRRTYMWLSWTWRRCVVGISASLGYSLHPAWTRDTPWLILLERRRQTSAVCRTNKAVNDNSLRGLSRLSCRPSALQLLSSSSYNCTRPAACSHLIWSSLFVMPELCHLTVILICQLRRNVI